MKQAICRFILGVTASAVFALAATMAHAQPYPSRPIKLIIPYAPGGNTDIVARIFGQRLSERVGQPVVFDNRGGATGTLGVGVAAKSPNDGYTIVIGDLGSMVIANHAIPSRPYDPIKDFSPIALGAGVSNFLTLRHILASVSFELDVRRFDNAPDFFGFNL